MDGVIEQGGLGGVGIIDEDAILTSADEERPEEDKDRGAGVYLHPHRQQHEETDTDTDDYGEGGDKLFMSRWSLTSSIDNTLPSSIGGRASMVSAFTVGSGGTGAGGLFASKKTKSVEKEKGIEDKETEKQQHTDHNNTKKRGRLVSFISRISSNIASPPHSASSSHYTININTPSSPSTSFATFRTNEGSERNSELASLVNNGYWFGDKVPRPPPLSPTGNKSTAEVDGGKKGKDKNKERDEEAQKVDVNDEETDKKKRDSLPPVPIDFPAMADGADSTTISKNANHKAQLILDTSTHGAQLQLPFGLLPNASSPVPSLLSPPRLRSSSSPRLRSSLEPHESSGPREDQSTMLGATHQHQHQHHQQTGGLKPIVKAFSDGFKEAGSSGVVGIGRARSSSAADLLGGGSGSGYHDAYQRQQYHQQAFGQQGQVQGLSQGQPGQARRYAPGYPLDAQPPQEQNRQQGYPPSSQRHRRQSQLLQFRSEFQPQQQRDGQSYSPVTGGGYHVLQGTSSLRSPTAATDAHATTVPRRPGLVKSVSTSMLNMSGSGSGGYYGLQQQYASVVDDDDEKSDVGPDSPLLFATPCGDDDDDESEEWGEEEEEEYYGVEVRHGQWRSDGGGGGGGLAEREAEHQRLETELNTLRREPLEEHSTTATTTTVPIATPRVSTEEVSPSSSAAPSIIRGHTRSSSNGSNNSTHMVKTKEQLLAQRVDMKHTRLGSMSHLSFEGASVGGAVAVAMVAAPTPTSTVKTTSGSSKGFRGFVERMKLVTTTTTTTTGAPSSTTSSPLSASPIIPPPMISSTNVSATSTTAAATSASNASYPSSPSVSHSPINPFVMGGGGGGGSPGDYLNDGLFGPDNQKKKQKRQPKRKLVIKGVDENDVKGYEAVKAWCEVSKAVLFVGSIFLI